MADQQPTHIGNEIWKPVPDWEDRYEVSNHGRVRTLPLEWKNQFGATIKRPPRIRKPATNRTGYTVYSLYRNDSSIQYFAHRLVLEAFVGPKPDGMVCCHNDGNPANNRVENLRWDTPAANNQDQIKHGTICRGVRNGNNKHSPQDIRNIRRLYRTGKMNQRQIGEAYGIRQAAVSNIVRRRSWAWLSD